MTNGEELADLVRAGDVDAVRRACVKIASDRTTKVQDNVAALSLDLIRLGLSEISHEVRTAAWYVALLSATPKQMTSTRVPPYLDPETTAALIGSRPRAERDAWVALGFDRHLTAALRLVARGCASRPPGAGYTLALIRRPLDFHLGKGKAETVLDMLRQNPHLLEEEIWHLFSVEGEGASSLAAYDKYTPPHARWHDAILALVADEMLDRDRVLDGCLQALTAGFAAFRSRWFSGLLKALSPSAEETKDRMQTHLDLLASPNGPTVTTALAGLTSVAKQGELNPDDVLNHFEPALISPSKTTARSALKLVIDAAGLRPGRNDKAVDLCLVALGHPTAEVQQQALGAIRAIRPTPTTELTEQLLSMASDCHPTTIAAIDDWIGETSTEVGDPSWSHYEPADHPAEVELGSERRAVIDLDALALLTTQALEQVLDPDRLEDLVRSLALADRAVLIEDARFKTLGRRALKLIRSYDLDTRHLIAPVVAAALVPDEVPDAPAVERLPRPTIDQLLNRRLAAIAERFRSSSDRFEPLAAPTHDFGIIDPTQLAERMQDQGDGFDDAELALALLRLPPSQPLLERALHIVPTTARGEAAVDWMKSWASYCRSDLDRTMDWSVKRWQSTHASTTYNHARLEIRPRESVGPRVGLPTHDLVATRASTDDPQVLRGRGVIPTDGEGVCAWLGLCCPALPATWSELVFSAAGANYGSPEVEHGLPSAFDRFFDPLVPIPDDGLYLLALGMADPRTAVRIRAIDATLDTIVTRRLDAAGLGEAIARLARSSLVNAKRFTRAFDEIDHGIGVGSDVVTQILAHALAMADEIRPQSVIGLLNHYEQLQTRAPAPSALPPETIDSLSSLTGRGKAAATAARILEKCPR